MKLWPFRRKKAKEPDVEIRDGKIIYPEDQELEPEEAEAKAVSENVALVTAVTPATPELSSKESEVVTPETPEPEPAPLVVVNIAEQPTFPPLKREEEPVFSSFLKEFERKKPRTIEEYIWKIRTCNKFLENNPNKMYSVPTPKKTAVRAYARFLSIAKGDNSLLLYSHQWD